MGSFSNTLSNHISNYPNNAPYGSILGVSIRVFFLSFILHERDTTVVPFLSITFFFFIMHAPVSRTDSAMEEDTIVEKKSAADWQEKAAGNVYMDEDPLKDEAEQERKLVKALDRRLLPLFCVFYFTDFLDRANIGNATWAYTFHACQHMDDVSNRLMILGLEGLKKISM